MIFSFLNNTKAFGRKYLFLLLNTKLEEIYPQLVILNMTSQVHW